MRKYQDPDLQKSGGSLLLVGLGGTLLVEVEDERWDAAMPVAQSTVVA